jgi:hypothetical protein
MGRKKIDKESISYLIKQLWRKDMVIGFQFTAGRTPRAISENENYGFSFSLNFSESSHLPDFSNGPLEEKIMQTFFPEYHRYSRLEITSKAMTRLREIWNELGYEVDGAEYAGEWSWFRVKCKFDEIENHVNILKEILKDFDRLA